MDLRVDHGGFAFIVFEQSKLFFDDLRLLKFEGRCMFHHQLFQFFYDGADVTLDNLTDILYRSVIIFFALLTNAGSKAIANMIFEADFEFSAFNIFLTEIVFAVSERIE